MKTPLKHIRSLSILLLLSLTSLAEIKLPRLISDGMVLQRGANVKIWGWAAGDEKVSVGFNGSVYTTTANTAGEWVITLSGLKAGGPYAMTVSGSNTLTIKDIAVGDVWFCSGQSNMENQLERLAHIYGTDIANATYPFIRHFSVPQKYDFNTPQNDLASGAWQSATPQNVLKFSTVAYFFARDLYEKYHVPVGLINASLGGSPAEAWISEEAVKKFPEHYKEMQRFRDNALITQTEKADKERMDAWYGLLQQKDEGSKDPSKLWSNPEVNTSDWNTMKVPGYWANEPLGAVNGVVWFRKDITVPASMAGKPAKLILGRLVDADNAYINGTFVGNTGYQYPFRRYNVPAGLLKEGINTIVIRIVSNSGKGGFVLDKSYELVSEGQTIDLRGDWLYKLGATMEPLGSQTFIRWKPVGLYNAMISPLLNYSIKGVIWYQGESNAGRAVEYRQLLPALINDWRSNWHQGNFPFVIVQLPNFMETKAQPSESDWAMLRDSQFKTLSLPNTGMVVAIDLGEWNDIHPVNKKDIGKRLALTAGKVAYGDNKTVYSGPVYQSVKITGNKAVLTFASVGSGLVAKGGGELKYFAIAGNDKQFVWAQAKIEDNKVIVWSDKVTNPIAVRYGWADNPEGANLYNKEGLPASPFRTDDFDK